MTAKVSRPRPWLRDLEPGIVLATAGLVAFSLAAIASASYSMNPGDRFFFVRRQLLWLVVAVGAAVVARIIDYRVIVGWAGPLYVLNLVLLAAVLVVGRQAQGAQRWIPLGPFDFQPSELAKLIIVITLAAHLGRREVPLRGLREAAPYVAHVTLPLLLILVQPDLGTSLVLGAVLLGMLYAAGVPGGRLVAVVGAGLSLVVAAIWAHLNWGVPLPLRDYQLNRLLVFLQPGRDPLGAGYHLLQSKIAIGSGEFWGKHLFYGTQNQLNFLPNRHTDFVFSVIGEELGFAGGIAVLGLYCYLMYRILRVARVAGDYRGALICIGVASMLSFHVLVNVGMTVGIMPITGIPLPFVSYGGSSLVTCMMSLGLVLNVYGRRHGIRF
ncbi:MAG: rod shape-determining protein RodA [Bacillota bacterium]|nr:rod shape-determining protein RodA [Bacillota bacterium]